MTTTTPISMGVYFKWWYINRLYFTASLFPRQQILLLCYNYILQDANWYNLYLFIYICKDIVFMLKKYMKMLFFFKLKQHNYPILPQVSPIPPPTLISVGIFKLHIALLYCIKYIKCIIFFLVFSESNSTTDWQIN